MAVGPLAKTWDVLKLALGDRFVKCSRVAVVFQDFFTVQPMFDVLVARNDAGVVPFTDRVGMLVQGRPESKS